MKSICFFLLSNENYYWRDRETSWHIKDKGRACIGVQGLLAALFLTKERAFTKPVVEAWVIVFHQKPFRGILLFLLLFLSQPFSIYFEQSVVQPRRNYASNNSFLKEAKGAQSRICISHVPNKDSSFKNSPENSSLFFQQTVLDTTVDSGNTKMNGTYSACQKLTIQLPRGIRQT